MWNTKVQENGVLSREWILSVGMVPQVMIFYIKNDIIIFIKNDIFRLPGVISILIL